MSDIAINPVTRRVQFTGNTGTGPYAFTFNVLQSSDIVVYKNNVLLTETTDYTVSIDANGTGNITMVVALVLTDILTIIGGRELSRTTDFVTAGDLLASSLNEQLDSNVIMSQQLDERFGRTLAVPPGDEDATLNLPLVADRAGKLISFTTSGSVTSPETTAAQLDAAVSSFINATGNNASSILYDPSGTGAVQTTVQSKLRQTVSVKDFGAVGDGTSDDTTEIQAALTAASGTSNVYLPAGTYIVSATIFIPSNTYFFGDGKSSIIKMIGTEGRNTTVVMTGFRNNKRENIVIENMQIDFNRTRWAVTGGNQLTDAFNGTAGYSTYQDNDETALSICYSENVLVKNVWAIDGYKHCIDVTAPAYRTGTDGATYDSQPSKNVTLQNCYVSGGGDDNITTHHSTDINIIGCWSENPSGVRIPQNSNCIEIDDGSRNVFVTNCVTIGGNYGLQIKGHDYAPAPYNVIVNGLRAVNNTQGVELRHSGWYANKATFSGDGSTTAFTLPSGYTVSPVVYVGGVKQTSGFSVSGVTLTFTSAPASGTDNIVVYKADEGEDPEIVDEEGITIAYTGTSPTARNVMLSNISVIAPKSVAHPTVTTVGGTAIPNVSNTGNVSQSTYNAIAGMRIRSYENVNLVNVSFNDSTLDLADDYSDATALSTDAVCRVYNGASNILIKNMSIYGFGSGDLEMERGLYTTNSLVGPISVDGFASSNGPEHPIRCSEAGSLYEGYIDNFLISGSQSDKIAVYVTCPFVQVGSGTVTGYGSPSGGGIGSTDVAQPKGMTFSRTARSSSGNTTTPVSVMNFDWYERASGQNLGLGEGLKQSWRTQLDADDSPVEVGFVGFIKNTTPDTDRMHDFVVGNSADGGTTAAAPVFEVASDGTVRPSANGSQSLGDASHRWSEVFASNGTINTSDERQKQDIADIDAAETRVAVVLKGKLKKFKFKDAVAAKGDNARVHIGVIAQEVKAAFEAEGLDAHDYAMLCYDQWTTGSEETGDLETHDSYGVRYTELLTFIISAM
jgi:hypothetical protein